MKSFKNVKYLVLAMVFILAISITGCTSENKDVVATVGDEKITQDELNDVLVKMYGKEALNSLISEKLVAQEIKKNDIKVSDEDVDKEMEALENQYKEQGGLEAALKNSNMTEADLKDQIINQLSLEKLLADDIKVSDEEVAAYYEENKEQFSQGEQVDASHILVESEDLAKEIKGKLDDGGDMAALAKEYSTDPGSKDNGGKLGFFGKGQMVPEFEEAAFSNKVGEISDPIKSEHGYHIIVVNEKKEATTGSLEENKEDIKALLEKQKMPQAFSAWYAKTAEEYKITNTLTDEK